jgi:hypothetical protein
MGKTIQLAVERIGATDQLVDALVFSSGELGCEIARRNSEQIGWVKRSRLQLSGDGIPFAQGQRLGRVIVQSKMRTEQKQGKGILRECHG